MKTKITSLLLLINLITFGQSTITSEEILIKNDSIELPGTLTFSNQKTPLIIWVHGSGNVDRNGNQGTVVKANYIKQFRDSINKNDIAFFSYDKRTANKNNSKFLQGVIFTDFVSDIKKVIAHFKNDKRFTEIILIGHSQGSLIAMLASENSDKYISLAGPSTTIDKTIILQIKKQSPFMVPIVEAHIKELKETGTIKEVNPLLASLFNKNNQPFFVDWMKYNPSVEIKKLHLPLLIINGTKDIQVKIADAKELHNANKKSTLVLIDNMNHVLKHIDKDEDNLASYYSADFKLSEKLVETIVKFIKN